MKFILTSIAMICSAIAVQAQHTLTVNVANLLPKGVLELSVYNKKEGFPIKAKPYVAKKVKISGSNAAVSFSNLPAGDYAVALYQDENSNGKCDTNFIGYPTEGFGFSNNVKPKLAPPTFTETKVRVDQNKTINIKVIR